MNHIEKMVELVKGSAKVAIEENNAEYPPMAFVDTPQGIIGLGFGNEMTDEFKQSLPQLLRKLLRLHSALSYILVMEGWQASPEATEKIMEQGKKIRDLPLDDRTEVLLGTICEKGKQPQAMIAPIYNTPQGRKLGDFHIGQGFGGKLAVTDW